MTTKVLVVHSGGLDSTVLLKWHLNRGFETRAISFNYRQRHVKELDAAARICDLLRVPHDVIDLTSVGRHLQSVLTVAGTEVPEGHYAAASMKATVVPNRNMIMLAIAAGVAASHGISRIATAVHAGDHAIYADCRPEFIQSLNRALGAAFDGADTGAYVSAPFVKIDKAEIVRIGHHEGAPMQMTWSCYKGEALHCGKCGTCVERREAFALAGVPDLTQYAGELAEASI